MRPRRWSSPYAAPHDRAQPTRHRVPCRRARVVSGDLFHGMKTIAQSNGTCFNVCWFVANLCCVCVPITLPPKAHLAACIGDLIWFVVQHEGQCRVSVDVARDLQAYTVNGALAFRLAQHDILWSLDLSIR